ncbi:MAG: spore coat protein CotJB [Bacillota bacterium]|nr:spore coat protein CotJB [Bacillota bacterium]
MVDYGYDDFMEEYLQKRESKEVNAKPMEIRQPEMRQPEMRTTPMSNRQESLLRKIQEYEFYAIDLNLYLDTHPTDKRALRMFKETVEKSKQLESEYVENYGPLKASDATNKDYWTWIESPWPWER